MIKFINYCVPTRGICIFVFSIGRLILTKQPFIYDPNGDKDREDITEQYKAKEGTPEERLSLYNAVRGTNLAKTYLLLFFVINTKLINMCTQF